MMRLNTYDNHSLDRAWCRSGARRLCHRHVQWPNPPEEPRQ